MPLPEHYSPVSDSTFDKEVLQAETPTLVVFWASWSHSTTMMLPALGVIGELFGDKLYLTSVDADREQQTPVRYNITTLPTILIFDEGFVVEHLSGATDLHTLSNTITECLSDG